MSYSWVNNWRFQHSQLICRRGNLTRTIRGLRVEFVMKQMIFKNLNVSFFPKRLVMVPRSRQFYRLILLHTIAHKYMKTTCLCRPTLPISCCRNSAYIQVCFWRHDRIANILMRCFRNRKKETACNLRMTYQTVRY